MEFREVRSGHGTVILFDPAILAAAFGAHAVRVTPEGEMQVLIVGTDSTEWVQVEEADLVQPVGKPNGARKN